MRRADRTEPARPRLLVVRTDTAAGFVCTLPLLRALREGHPSAWLGTLTTEGVAPLARLHPDVSEALAAPRDGTRGVVAPARLMLSLRARRIDDIIVADAVPAQRLVALLRRTGARRVVQADADGSSPRMHEIDRVLALGASFGARPRVRAGRLYPESAEVMRVRAALAARGRDMQRPLVGVHVGGAEDAERWPAERFAALMRQRNDRDGSTFMLLWSPDDRRDPDEAALVAREIHTRLIGVPCLRWPVAGLAELIAALGECDSVIAPMGDVPHLAAAVGRPVVALCGAVDAQRWRPVGVAHELARAPAGSLADVTVAQAFAACEVLAARTSVLGAG
jgi:ADP-heptose:LPS heptosyltransferase